MGASYNFALRLDDEMRQKIRIIAEKNKRSINKEIEFALEKHIAAYEKEHGEIPLPKEDI